MRTHNHNDSLEKTEKVQKRDFLQAYHSLSQAVSLNTESMHKGTSTRAAYACAFARRCNRGAGVQCWGGRGGGWAVSPWFMWITGWRFPLCSSGTRIHARAIRANDQMPQLLPHRASGGCSSSNDMGKVLASFSECEALQHWFIMTATSTAACGACPGVPYFRRVLGFACTAV